MNRKPAMEPVSSTRAGATIIPVAKRTHIAGRRYSLVAIASNLLFVTILLFLLVLLVYRVILWVLSLLDGHKKQTQESNQTGLQGSSSESQEVSILGYLSGTGTPKLEAPFLGETLTQKLQAAPLDSEEELSAAGLLLLKRMKGELYGEDDSDRSTFRMMFPSKKRRFSSSQVSSPTSGSVNARKWSSRKVSLGVRSWPSGNSRRMSIDSGACSSSGTAFVLTNSLA